MSLPGLTAVTAHAGLARFEQGDRVLAGRVGHWHADGPKRVWVKGTVEGCEAGMEDLSDEDLLAKIREADEAIDPMPQFERLADANAIRFLDEAPEIPHHRPPNAPTRFISTKPQRGGKRTCMNLVGADCGHSESRHNANGSCRTCGCTEFMVKDES